MKELMNEKKLARVLSQGPTGIHTSTSKGIPKLTPNVATLHLFQEGS